MTLKTDINSISRSQLLKLNKALTIACTERMGTSNPKIRTTNRTSSYYMGYYDIAENTIFIYRCMLDNVEEYVKVFIHEWTHSRQPKIFAEYDKAEAKYGYRNNPFEIEARSSEKEYKSEIWKQVKKIMK